MSTRRSFLMQAGAGLAAPPENPWLEAEAIRRRIAPPRFAGKLFPITRYGAKGGFLPVVRNIRMSNVTCRKSRYALYLRGFDQSPIDGVSLENCEFDGVGSADVIEHVRGLSLRGVKVNGQLRS